MSVVAELAGGSDQPRRISARRRAGSQRARWWLRRKAVAGLMNLLIAVTAAVAVLSGGQAGPGEGTWGSWVLRLFALWCLAFLPGWLYVRFLQVRKKALWQEYVLNLHRLGWDKPGYLPRPPAASAFYAAWSKGKGAGSRADSIYRQKFDAYYGRDMSKDDDRDDDRDEDRVQALRRVPPSERVELSYESLFPLFLATAVFAAGWTAVLWDTGFVTAPAGAWDVLKYGFIGAYAFVASMLIRRFFQSDLRASAYASAVYRILFVLLIVATMHQVIGSGQAMASHAEMAAAFVIGFFPLVGLQVLQRGTSVALRKYLPRVTPDYPLDQLDGLNLWYEARLTEEGVEDMQNLTTMNLVDVILHTRVPAGRLVDWTDQAFLLIHLEPAERGELSGRRPEAGGAESRRLLRRVGVRTATDLLKAFSVEQPQPDGSLVREFELPEGVTPPLDEGQLRLLVKVLAQEPGLNPVWNWHRNGVQAHQD
jgi:hypothetical protein